MAEATSKVKTTARPASQGSVSTFDSKVETPRFEIPKFEFPKFDMPKMEIPAAFREFAERSVAQARDGYERMKAVAEDATDVLEDTYASASKCMTDYALKSLEIARYNTNAAFDFVGELIAVKSCAEALELSTVHAQKQFGVLTAQTKELSALAQKVANDVAEPMKEGVATRSCRRSARPLSERRPPTCTSGISRVPDSTASSAPSARSRSARR